MVTQNKKRIEALVGTAILTALVVVLQVFASGIKIGAVSLTFSLVPIVLGAILYGPLSGAFLGGVFGVVVTVATVTGVDPGAYMMFEKLPALTVVLCLVKGIAAGLIAGLVCRAFTRRGHDLAGIFIAALVCPIVNTGIFCAALLTFYRDIATQWMGSTVYSNLFIYVLLGIVGINFLLELAINIILAPGIERVIYAVRKSHPAE